MARPRKRRAAAAASVPDPPPPIEQKTAKQRRVAPRKKNVITMPFFLRNGVKVTVEGDIADFTWDAKHDRLIISTGAPADQVAIAPMAIALPQARILGPSVPSGSVEASGIEYTDNGPGLEEARLYRGTPGVAAPDMGLPLNAVLNLERQAASIAAEKLHEVKHEEESN